MILFGGIYISAQCTLDIITTDPTCGDTNGEALININNGVPPYNYTFLGQTETTSDNPIYLFGLAEGTYSFNLTDDNGCQQAVDLIINGSPPMSITTTSTFATCDLDNGCIDVTLTGGIAPYVFEWDAAPDIEDPCGLPAGVYTVTVTDDNNCSVIATVVIDQTQGPDVFISEDIIDCNLSILTATSNVPGVIFEWSIGAVGPSIEVLSPGDYLVTIIDIITGCIATASYTYTGGSLFYQPTVNGILCFGESNGEIIGNFPNGNTPPNISWTGPNGFVSNDLNLSNLEVGQYTLTADDGMGCMNTFGPYEITEPSPMEITLISVDVTCNGAADGVIESTVFGGTPPYTYQWSDGNNTPAVIGVNAGTYDVTITDNNGCTVTSSTTISEPTPIEVIISATDQSCLEDGVITSEVSGGTGSYTYNWNNGDTTPDIIGLIAGDYSLTVTDSNGCFSVNDVTIESPIDLEVSSTFTDCNTNNGTATATVLGGATDPTFEWSTGATTATVTDLAPDWYSVTVTDGITDCKVHQNVQVQEDSTCYVIIEGYVYIDDIDQDCLIDSETIPATQVRVELSDGQVIFTNSDGYYQFIADAGTYTITIEPNANFADLCSSPISIDALEWGMTFSNNDFYLKYSELIDIQLKVVKFNARPGFTQTVRICLMNRGAVPVSGTLSFTHPELLDFISSNPMETSYDSTTSTVTFDYTDIPPNTTWIYNPKLQVPIGTPLGTPLDYSFSAPTVGDISPWNNEEACTILVTGSYDPNDKAVAPAGVGPEGIISMEDSILNYKVRFQNTGTDTAFTVLIRDTLDADLDWRTFEPGPASHDYVASIVDGNIVELLFENILLPDSFVNEPASNGFVMFDIKIKSGSPYGTRIENTAGIYFDFNPPIITNTVQNLIEMIVDVDEINDSSIDLALSPNPSSEFTQLEFSLEESATTSITLYDSQGSLVKILEEGTRREAGFQKLNIPLQELSSGIYFVRLSSNNGKVGLVKLLRF